MEDAEPQTHRAVVVEVRPAMSETISQTEDLLWAFGVLLRAVGFGVIAVYFWRYVRRAR